MTLRPDHSGLSGSGAAPQAEANTADYDPVWFDRLDRVEARHFWFRARRNVIARLFERYARRSDRVLEIGAGTGSVAAALAARGFNVAVSDVHHQALEHAGRKGLAERYEFNLMAMPFRDHFDVIGLFDVLEHLDDDRAALLAIRQALKPGGRLILTVPAHRWLWNQSDVLARHKRRYGLKEIRQRVAAAGFDLLDARCFFASLVPLLLLRTLVSPGRRDDKQQVAAGLSVVPIANEIMFATLSLDNLLSGWLRPAAGGSIAVVARKSASAPEVP